MTDHREAEKSEQSSDSSWGEGTSRGRGGDERSRSEAKSPPSRLWGWRAELRDGLVLDELHEGQVVCRFDDIPLERLARFSLREAATGREVIGVDCATGLFRVEGHHVDFRLGPRPLTRREGVAYWHVAQRKSAHMDWRAGAGSSGVVIDAHDVGCWVKPPEGCLAVVATLQARTGRVGLDVTFYPGPGELPLPGPLVVEVDGVAVATEGELEAALAPRAEVR